MTGLGYVGIFFRGLDWRLHPLGLDLSNLAIVAGALSVGIGFGLQNNRFKFCVWHNLVNRKRPIKLGDWVEVGVLLLAMLRNISVRCNHVLKLLIGRTVIIAKRRFDHRVHVHQHEPLKNKQGRVIVPIGVAYGSNPDAGQSTC